jgi:hypothetical protein
MFENLQWLHLHAHPLLKAHKGDVHCSSMACNGIIITHNDSEEFDCPSVDCTFSTPKCQMHNHIVRKHKSTKSQKPSEKELVHTMPVKSNRFQNCISCA